jgi:predicted dehydrogenase
MLVHMVDLAIWYFGAVENAEFLARDLLRPTRVIQGREVIADAEDYVVVRLKMASGVEVLCQADLVTPAFTQVAEVQGENGTFMGSIVSSMPSFVYCSEARAGYPAGQTPLQFGRHSVFEAQMAEFVRAVRLQKQPSRCTVQDSVVLMQALEQLKNGGSRHETNSN